MSEAVRLYERASGTWIIGCAVNLCERGVYAPLCKPVAAGLMLWCRDCKAEHLFDWEHVLRVMGKFRKE